jgi:hypothetical protein
MENYLHLLEKDMFLGKKNKSASNSVIEDCIRRQREREGRGHYVFVSEYNTYVFVAEGKDEQKVINRFREKRQRYLKKLLGW